MYEADGKRGRSAQLAAADGQPLGLRKAEPLHEKGLTPAVAVDVPDVDFGQPEPTTDPILEKALERFAEKKAA